MADITSNLSAYWPLNQNQNDYSGNGYHGTNHGQIFENNYQKFDHTYIEIGDVLNSELQSGHVTISYNFYVEQHTDDYPQDDWGQILQKWYSQEYSNNSFIVSQRHVILDKTYTFPYAYRLFKWYNYAFTFNDGILKLYVNGNLIRTCDNTQIRNSAGRSLMIGNMWNGRYNFIGKLNNIRIYNRTLTDSDILALYNNDKYEPNIVTIEETTHYVVFVDYDNTPLQIRFVPTGGTQIPPDTNPSRPDYTFIGWDKSLTNITQPTVFTAQYIPNQVTVTFRDWNGTILKVQTINYGQSQTQPSNPTREGYTFVGWDKPFDNVTSNLIVTQLYTINQYTVTITKVGQGTVTGSGTYNHGDSVTIIQSPATGYHFVNWTGDITGTESTKIFIITKDMSIQQNFEINTCQVNISINGNGSVTGQGTYDYGETVTITQIPDTGYHFVNWSGDITGTELTKTFTITRDMNIVQNFEINTYTVNITINGSGTVTGSGTYNHGETVTITQIPEEGYHLQNWSGDLTGSELVKIFTITRDMNIVQNFEINTYTVNIIIDGNGSVNKIPDKSIYEHNEILQIKQIPDTGYKFVNWSGDLNSINDTENINVTSNMNITQQFEIIQFEIKAVIKPPEGGTVIGVGLHDYGSEYTLQQIPNDGYRFVGWEIGECEE